MTDKLIPIAFPLTPRMQCFIELRDTLRSIVQAMHEQSPYAWLAAEKEFTNMLLGEGNKKPAGANILSLFHTMGKHFKALAEKHPDFKDNLLKAVAELERHAENIRLVIPPACDFLRTDALLTAYAEVLRKQDPLGLHLALPQIIKSIWHVDKAHSEKLYHLIKPLIEAIEHLNQMLHAHVPWETRMAKGGSDQITLASQDDVGLLIVGIPEETLSRGVIPSCSGFRSLIRLRFSHWEAGKAEKDWEEDQPYALMMVPFS